MQGAMKKLKTKWGISTDRDFYLIMLVFSLAGMFVSACRKPIFHYFKIDQAPLWLKILIYIPLIMPLYQMGLIIFGTLLGQFNFFWEKQKRVGRAIAKLAMKIFAFILPADGNF